MAPKKAAASTKAKASTGKAASTKAKSTAAASSKSSTTKSKSSKSAPKSVLKGGYAGLIAEAIGELKERGGSSRQAIKNYIQENHKAEAESVAFDRAVRQALKHSVENGSLIQIKQSFKLASKDSAAAAAAAPMKKATTKKTAAAASPKKATAKKATTTKAKALPKKVAAPKSANPKKASGRPVRKAKTEA